MSGQVTAPTPAATSAKAPPAYSPRSTGSAARPRHRSQSSTATTMATGTAIGLVTPSSRASAPAATQLRRISAQSRAQSTSMAIASV